LSFNNTKEQDKQDRKRQDDRDNKFCYLAYSAACYSVYCVHVNEDSSKKALIGQGHEQGMNLMFFAILRAFALYLKMEIVYDLSLVLIFFRDQF